MAAQQVRDGAADAERTLTEVAGRLGLEAEPAEEPLEPEKRADLEGRIERLARRREQLGPVNPLAAQEYEEAVAARRGARDPAQGPGGRAGRADGPDQGDRPAHPRELRGDVRGRGQELRGGGRPPVPGRPRPAAAGAAPTRRPRPVLGGDAEDEPGDAEPMPMPMPPSSRRRPEQGVEVEVTPAGKSTKRLSLLSGGEKSLVALAFMFAVFLARPCPFYILDEVEAALDDLNIDRFLQLVRRYSDRAQFIVVTHQKRTMDAADGLYGVSMGGDGVSKVVSRRLDRRPGGRRGRCAPPKSPQPKLRRVARTWQELFTVDDVPRAPPEDRRRAPARGLLQAPAREHVQDAPGARRRAPGHDVRDARRRGLRAARGDADLRRRRRADHGEDRRAPRGRGHAPATCRAART